MAVRLIDRTSGFRLEDVPLRPGPHAVLIVQTASGYPYQEMVSITAPYHRRFCERQGFDYYAYAGVLRGFHPWQSAFNRIEFAKALLRKGFRGWLVHLDADAVIAQPSFDLRAFLDRNAASALIIASGGAPAWNVNDGVFFLNYGSEAGRKIADRWWRGFHRMISLHLLRTASTPWMLADGRPSINDQDLLQWVLKTDSALFACVKLADGDFINYAGGSFIRQFLRTFGTDQERLQAVRQLVSTVWCEPAQGAS